MSRTEDQWWKGAFLEKSSHQKPGSLSFEDGSAGAASESDLPRGLLPPYESSARHTEGNDRGRSQTGPHRLSHGHHSSGIRHDRFPRTGAARSGPEANETPSSGPRTRFRPRREGGCCSLGVKYQTEGLDKQARNRWQVSGASGTLGA